MKEFRWGEKGALERKVVSMFAVRVFGVGLEMFWDVICKVALLTPSWAMAG